MNIRRAKPFFKGVHVKDCKHFTKDLAIEVFPSPTLAVISLGQHIGKPAECVVNVGDYVKVGQIIGKKSGFVSANVHSSVSGWVECVENRQSASGKISAHVVIKNDFTDEKDFLPPLDNPNKEEILQRITDCGIVGMGGAGFPLDVKLTPKNQVDTLVINGAECEPYLTCDHRLMKEKLDEIVTGIRLIAKVLDVKVIVVGIEKNKPDAIENFAKIDGFTVVPLKKTYPMGSEKHLIYCTTGRKVPQKHLPSDVGVVVTNVSTAYAVYESVVLGKPLYERVMTVSGNGASSPKNLLVKNGTSYTDLRQECGAKQDVKMFVAGGPMMGQAMISTDVYTTKTSSGFLMLLSDECTVENPTPCINCGACGEVCPMNLLPMQIDFFTQAGDYEKANTIGGAQDCISCGACAYVCPARRALIQSITLCKKKLAEKGGARG